MDIYVGADKCAQDRQISTMKMCRCLPSYGFVFIENELRRRMGKAIAQGKRKKRERGGRMRRESCYWDLKSGIEPKKQTAEIYKSLAKLKVTCHYSDIDMKGTELRTAAEREADRDRDSNNWKATQVGRSQSMMTAQTWACKWNWPQWELQQQQWQQARKLCSSMLES